MKKTTIRSINSELIGGLIYGLFFLGFTILIFVSLNNFDPLYVTIPFIMLIITINLLNSLKQVSFCEHRFTIKADLGITGKIQLSHKIDYKDIKYARLEQLEINQNSFHKSIDHKTKGQQLLMSRYSVAKCITFYMEDDTKQSLLVYKYTKKQINRIIDEIKNRGIVLQNIGQREIFVNQHSNIDGESTQGKMIKYPPILGIITIFGVSMFFFYIYYSLKQGGGPADLELASRVYDGYIEGRYYLSNHGDYTEVSYEMYQRMKVLETTMMISFALTFISNGIYTVKNQKLLKNRGKA